MTAGPTHRALFRADASLDIGTGHVARCLALAAELIRRDWTATLASRSLPTDLETACRAAGIAVEPLPAEGRLEDEPGLLEGQLRGRVDALVVDHYGIDAGWHRAVADWAGTLLAVDDLADRPQAVDVLVNQNLGVEASRYATLTRPGTRVLVGPAYALLDPAFAVARRDVRPRAAVRRLLVFLSGGDPRDVTARAARAAATIGVPVDVVVGGSYPHRERLEGWAADLPGIVVHVATRRMAELMAGADLAVGAPSSAAWERCSVGLPSVLLTLADNQVDNARALAEAGAAISLGDERDVAEADIAEALRSLTRDPARLRAMSEAAAGLTDGGGTARVADELERAAGGPAGATADR
jgi:UDP-2,4-diacetamido-2,4,6-trideoxy-beta-L-altropyranose hydrolase